MAMRGSLISGGSIPAAALTIPVPRYHVSRHFKLGNFCSANFNSATARPYISLKGKIRVHSCLRDSEREDWAVLAFDTHVRIWAPTRLTYYATSCHRGVE